MKMNVTLCLKPKKGFGFCIVGGAENGSQVSIGDIVPGGAADLDGRLRIGDEIIAVDMRSIVHASHRYVVELFDAATIKGRVTISIQRWFPQKCISCSTYIF